MRSIRNFVFSELVIIVLSAILILAGAPFYKLVLPISLPLMIIAALLFHKSGMAIHPQWPLIVIGIFAVTNILALSVSHYLSGKEMDGAETWHTVARISNILWICGSFAYYVYFKIIKKREVKVSQDMK